VVHERELVDNKPPSIIDMRNLGKKIRNIHL
jgi:hypothetical protein